jgi:hypothetical protein
MGRSSSRGVRRSLGQIFAAPLLLGWLSGIGLISALLGDNVWDALSWVALGIPVFVVLRYWLRPIV